jgi:hypothetical protein
VKRFIEEAFGGKSHSIQGERTGSNREPGNTSVHPSPMVVLPLDILNLRLCDRLILSNNRSSGNILRPFLHSVPTSLSLSRARARSGGRCALAGLR